MSGELTLPNNWRPRAHQLPALRAFDEGRRRQIHIWHRRAGKDSFALNLAAKQSHVEIATYWHLFPEQTQARKAVWHAIDNTGQRIIDRSFPLPLRESTLSQEMMVKFRIGSTWQLCGSDNYNSLVGSNVKGVIFSEWALCDPAAWDYIRPIILENNGWAVFITTYRGKNHAYKMYVRQKDDPEWFCSLCTVNDTQREDGSPIITPEMIEQERREGMSDPMIEQEYFCSPMAAFEGSYYAKEMREMEQQGRMGPFGFDPQLPLYSAWDLGYSDHLTCVLMQPKGNEHTCVGSRSWRFTNISAAVADLQKTYPFGNKIKLAILPHDANVQHIENIGLPIELAPKLGVAKGIDVTRDMLPLVRIDTANRPWAPDGANAHLIDALNGYRTEFSKSHPEVFQLNPAHTWESHFADAVRYYCSFVQVGGIASQTAGGDPNVFARTRRVI